MLGDDDGRALLMLVAKWFGPDKIDELLQAKTRQVLLTRVAVPHAGWPRWTDSPVELVASPGWPEILPLTHRCR